MRFGKRLGIGLLSAGVSLGWAGASFGEDKPAGDKPPAGERREGRPDRPGQPDRPDRPERREGFRPDPKRMMERMQESFKDLNLSEEQKTKIKAIADKAQTDLDAALKGTEGQEPRANMEKVRGIIGPAREEMMEVLDETQREKLRENMRNAFGGGGGGGGRGGREFGPGGGPGGDRPRGDRPGRPDRPQGRPGGGPPDGRGPGGPGGGGDRAGMMIERLRDNLGKLQLNDEQKKKIEALLSDTEKKLIDLRAEADKQAAEMRGKFREQMQTSRELLNAILTEEQRKQLEEMAPPRPGPDDRDRRPDGDRGEPRGPRDGDRPGGPPPAQ